MENKVINQDEAKKLVVEAKINLEKELIGLLEKQLELRKKKFFFSWQKLSKNSNEIAMYNLRINIQAKKQYIRELNKQNYVDNA